MSKYPKWLGLSVIAIVLTLAGTVGVAQQPKKISRIGVLVDGSAPSVAARVEAFRRGLRDLGYVERKNIIIDYRYADGKSDRLPALAAELLRLKADVLVTTGPASTRAAKQTTATIPIIMAIDDDPVGSGSRRAWRGLVEISPG